MRIIRSLSLLMALWVTVSVSAAPKSYTLNSPDGSLTARIDSDGSLTYTLEYLGETIIAPSAISMTLSDGTVFASSRVLGVKKGAGDEIVSTPIYRKAHVRDHYNSLTIRFKECNIEFRAYDSGLAWRFISAARAPFIRFVSGFAEYTQGAMINKVKDNWTACYSEPSSAGTRCRQMAEYVIFDSPYSMLCDSPSYYIAEPEFTKALVRIPNVWDETKVISGRTGKYIAMARRKGNVWYVAAMTDWNARDLELDLSFISEKPMKAELYMDGINADTVASDYRREVRTIGPGFKAAMAPGGAFVARIEL